MTLLTEARIKKNISIKNIYYLLNLEGFLIFFHNNKNFTRFKNKILFQNKIKSFIVKNNLFLNLMNKTEYNLFSNLCSGPSGFIFIKNQEDLFKFFDFYYLLNSSDQLDFVLLAVYWRTRNRFLSLEAICDLAGILKPFKSLSEFLVYNYISVLQKLSSLFFSLIM